MVRLVLLFLCSLSISWACEPCNEPDAKQAFAEADLVVVGTREGEGVDPFVCGTNQKINSNSTTLRVLQVLKGVSAAETLAIRACYGMCTYGLFLSDNKKYVVFLRRTDSGIETLGCKAKELLVTDEKVTVGKRNVSLANLADYLKSSK